MNRALMVKDGDTVYIVPPPTELVCGCFDGSHGVEFIELRAGMKVYHRQWDDLPRGLRTGVLAYFAPGVEL